MVSIICKDVSFVLYDLYGRLGCIDVGVRVTFVRFIWINGRWRGLCMYLASLDCDWWKCFSIIL
jgi:hypothetical protein